MRAEPEVTVGVEGADDGIRIGSAGVVDDFLGLDRIPERAWKIVREIAKALRALERITPLYRAERYAACKPTGQALTAEYMGLTDLQTARISEVIEMVLESVQASAYTSLCTPCSGGRIIPQCNLCVQPSS